MVKVLVLAIGGCGLTERTAAAVEETRGGQNQ